MMRRLPLLILFLASTMIALPLAAQTVPPSQFANTALAGFGGALVIDGDEIIAGRTGAGRSGGCSKPRRVRLRTDSAKPWPCLATC